MKKLTVLGVTAGTLFLVALAVWYTNVRVTHGFSSYPAGVGFWQWRSKWEEERRQN